jgi:hypothetical protein
MLFETLSGLDATSLLAYLDPSLGSAQFQILMAALLSAGFFIRSYLVQARHLISRFFNKRVV